MEPIRSGLRAATKREPPCWQGDRLHTASAAKPRKPTAAWEPAGLA